jgi:hypothetical protein
MPSTSVRDQGITNVPKEPVFIAFMPFRNITLTKIAADIAPIAADIAPKSTLLA